MRWWGRWAAAFSLGLVGCATPRFDVRVRPVGAYDPAREAAAEAEVHALPWDGEYPVEVFVDQVPDGLVYERGQLSVAPAAADRFELLGRIESAHATSAFAAYAASTWWYYPMHDRHSAARDTFCKAQLPLRLLTLGMWSLLSPTSWPCQITYPTEERENLAIHVQELKRAATVLGANLVVARLESETQLAPGVYGGSTYRVGGVRVTGFAVLDRRRTAPRRPS